MTNQEELESACDMLEDQIEVLNAIYEKIRLNGGFISDIVQAIDHLNEAIKWNTVKSRKANS